MIPKFLLVISCCITVLCGAGAELSGETAGGSLYAQAVLKVTARLQRPSSDAEISISAVSAIANLLRLPLLTVSATSGVSERCAADLSRLLAAAERGETWPFVFLDSLGKPQPGLLNGATTWLGSFDQCLQGVSSGPPLNITGSYCLLNLQKPPAPGNASQQPAALQITIGSCWPDSCSAWDAANATSELIHRITGLVAAPAGGDSGQCRGRERDSVLRNVGALVMLSLLGLIATCLAAGTGIDLFERSLARNAVASRAEAAAAAAARLTTAAESPPSGCGGSLGGAAVAGLESSENEGDSEALIAAIGRDNQGRSRCLGIVRSVLLCFSVRTNAERLLSQKCQDGSLRCVNGIRFLSMSWVILGHTYVFGLMGASNLGSLVPKWLNDWTFQAILNATVSVDTFFVLSGMLVTYLFLRELEIRRGRLSKINWVRFYLHRYWRLTGPYMIILGVYTTLAQYASDGPRYPRRGFDKNCEATWWQNLIYVNNMSKMEDMCMAWSWYLANDMQFYIISPIFLIPMALKPLLGAAFAAVVTIASVATIGVRSTQTGQKAGFLTDIATTGDYTKPWFRIAPYLVGMLAGLAAHRILSGRLGQEGRHGLRLRWPLRILVWLIAVGLCGTVIYSLYDAERGKTDLSQPVASLYNSTFRLAWSLGVALVVLACITGNGGWSGELLSAGVFAPLSRLSYCAYLLHPVLMLAVETARRDTFQWNEWTPMGNFLAYLLATYLMAFAASLAFESPLIGLERLALTGCGDRGD